MNSVDINDPRWRQVGAPLAAQAVPTAKVHNRQYSLRKILGIWAAAVLPMVVLGWGVAPLVGHRVDLGIGAANNEAFTRAGLLTLGLIWQFFFAMGLIYREEGNVRWSTVRQRCWLNTPRDPRTGESRGRLWLWLLPILVVAALVQLAPLAAVWESLFPFLGEPGKYSFAELMASDNRKADLEGAWHVLALFVVLGVFNTILGEELLFRGVLLPRMQGVFGRNDWVANGILFGLYHLHQPWTIFSSTIGGTLCYALPTKRFRSTWMGVAVHSVETVIFVFLALGLVLGLA